MQENCLFCKIANKEIPIRLVYEDDSALAFLDIHPRAPGHTVVIPKVHAPTILELPDEMVGKFFEAVKKVDKKIIKNLAPDGITIGINQGAASGQEVAHLHVHLMPRCVDDKGSSIQSVVGNHPKESLDEILKKLVS